MFRPIAVVPLVFSLTAFILGMLCIFAGSKPGYLESANLLTVSFAQCILLLSLSLTDYAA